MNLTWKTLPLVFLTGTPLIGILWYLAAFFLASIILRLVFIKNDSATYAFVFLILINIFLGPYSFLLPCGGRFPFEFTHNAITVALPCISAGYLLHKHINFFRRWDLRWLLPALCLLCLSEDAALHYFHHNNGQSYLCSTLLLSTAWLLLCVKHPDAKLSLLCNIGKYHSANIYYFHLLLCGILKQFFPLIRKEPYAFLLFYCMAILVSCLLLGSKRFIKRRWKQKSSVA